MPANWTWMDNSMGYRCEGCGADGGLGYGYPDDMACRCHSFWIWTRNDEYRCSGCNADGGKEYKHPDAIDCECARAIKSTDKGRIGTDADGRRFLVLSIDCHLFVQANDERPEFVAIEGSGELRHPSAMKAPITWD
jgi:hypothetical protein